MKQRDVVTNAYELILEGAESLIEDWIDEDGQHSPSDVELIRTTAFQLLDDIRNDYERYVLETAQEAGK